MVRYTPLRFYPAFVINHPLSITATPRALVDAHARGDLPHIPLTELYSDAQRTALAVVSPSPQLPLFREESNIWAT